MSRILFCAALLICSGIASAAVYKWVDAQGKTQYGDRPPDGVTAELVPMLVSHPAASPPPATSRSAAANTVAQAATPAPLNSEQKKALAADLEAERAKQCAQAQDRYKTSVESRRLYKLGEDGQRVYLTSDEIDAERAAAKKDLDTVCNSAN